MNATLARHRIESGWPELMPQGFAAVAALEVRERQCDQQVADAHETGYEAGYTEAQTEAEQRERALEAQVTDLETELDEAWRSIRDLEGEISERDACGASAAPGSITRARLLRAHRAIGLRFAQARNETLAPRQRWSGKKVYDLVARLRDSVTPEFDAIFSEIEAGKTEAA